jgi:hypothetical protein
MNGRMLTKCSGDWLQAVSSAEEQVVDDVCTIVHMILGMALYKVK